MNFRFLVLTSVELNSLEENYQNTDLSVSLIPCSDVESMLRRDLLAFKIRFQSEIKQLKKKEQNVKWRIQAPNETSLLCNIL